MTQHADLRAVESRLHQQQTQPEAMLPAATGYGNVHVNLLYKEFLDNTH